MFTKKQDTVTVCGYEIKKLSAEKFIKTILGAKEAILKALSCATGDALGTVFLSQNPSADAFTALLLSNLDEIIEGLYGVIADLSGVPETALRCDPRIGINGVGEILKAVIAINGVESFFTGALPALRNVWQGIKRETETPTLASP